MKTKKHSLSVALLLVAGILVPASTESASAATTRPLAKSGTFVGGDLHTLIFTKAGLFVTGHQGGSASTDLGMTWKPVASLKNTDIMSWAVLDSTYFAGGHLGLHQSSDAGKSFKSIPFFGRATDVHALGGAANTVYLASPQVGLLRSTDKGKSWTLINQKIGTGFMGSMLVDPLKPERIIAMDMTNGLVTSSDGGITWSLFGGGLGAVSVSWNPKNHRELVALTMDGGARSIDSGKSWKKFVVPTGSAAVAISSDGLKIYVATLANGQARVMSSSDQGKSWA